MKKRKQPLDVRFSLAMVGAIKQTAKLGATLVDEALYTGLNQIPGNPKLKSNNQIIREIDQVRSQRRR